MKTYYENTKNRLLGRLSPFILAYLIVLLIPALVSGSPDENVRFEPTFVVLGLISTLIRNLLILGYIFETIKFVKQDEFMISGIFKNLSGRWSKLILIILSVVVIDFIVNTGIDLLLDATLSGEIRALASFISALLRIFVSLFLSYILIIYAVKYEENSEKNFGTLLGQAYVDTKKFFSSFFSIDFHYFGPAYGVLFLVFLSLIFTITVLGELGALLAMVGMVYMIYRLVRYYPDAMVTKITYYLEKKEETYDHD